MAEAPVGTPRHPEGRQGPPDARATPAGAGDDAGQADLADISLIAARAIRAGDTVWYRGRPHVVRDVSLSGGFGFRPCGPAAPYLGLAGVETMVSRGGRRKVGGKLTESGVTPHPFYTELGGETIGWVSYLLCQARKGPEDASDVRQSIGRLVWWARPRRAQRTLSTF